MSLANGDLKNEPCPQSWKMMKIRIRKQSVQHHKPKRGPVDQLKLRYIRYQITANGTKVLTNCQVARQTDGSWNLRTIAFQAAVSILGVRWGVGFASGVMRADYTAYFRLMPPQPLGSLDFILRTRTVRPSDKIFTKRLIIPFPARCNGAPFSHARRTSPGRTLCVGEAGPGTA
jgi:hypothetical protein